MFYIQDIDMQGAFL